MVQVLGYPSKRVGLFIKQSIIFRSDSNGEDLEGYAGAGLYDRYNDQQPCFLYTTGSSMNAQTSCSARLIVKLDYVVIL